MNTTINLTKKLTSILILLLMLINMVSCSKAKTLDLKESHENCLKYYNEIKSYIENRFGNVEGNYNFYDDSFGSSENEFKIWDTFYINNELTISVFLANRYEEEVYAITFSNGTNEYGDGKTSIDLSMLSDILNIVSGRYFSEKYLTEIIKKSDEKSYSKKEDDYRQYKIYYSQFVDFYGNWDYSYKVEDMKNNTSSYGDCLYIETLDIGGLTKTGVKQ